MPSSPVPERLGLVERVRIRSRVASARLARLRPTFLVLGAQKSGTTALYNYLQEHGAVLCARIKEVDYFDLNYTQGDGWYLSHFPARWRALEVRRRVGCAPAVGELSPDYLLDPRVPARVHAFDSSLQLVVLVRDPVERAYSHYLHARRRGRESLSFEEAIDHEEARLEPELERMTSDPEYVSPTFRQHSYLARGRYWEQLERWLVHFPREQLLVVESSSLRTDTASQMSELSAFLGVPDSRAERFPVIGATTYPAPLEQATRDRLVRYFEPHNRRLYELLGRDLGWPRPSPIEQGATPVDA
jgi:hypothetical protein